MTRDCHDGPGERKTVKKDKEEEKKISSEGRKLP